MGSMINFKRLLWPDIYLAWLSAKWLAPTFHQTLSRYNFLCTPLYIPWNTHDFSTFAHMLVVLAYGSDY